MLDEITFILEIIFIEEPKNKIGKYLVRIFQGVMILFLLIMLLKWLLEKIQT